MTSEIKHRRQESWKPNQNKTSLEDKAIQRQKLNLSSERTNGRSSPAASSSKIIPPSTFQWFQHVCTTLMKAKCYYILLPSASILTHTYTIESHRIPIQADRYRHESVCHTGSAG